MSLDRFDWLEFEGPAASSPTQGVEKDERQHLQEAARAFAEGDFEPALRSYSAALKCNKALLDAWAGQVYCLVRLGELREAQAWASKACGLFPDTAILESARAAALAASGLVGEARAASDLALEKAERTGLQDPHVWVDRAACLLADGKLDTALFCIEKARELCADQPDWDQRIAEVLLESGEPSHAMAHLNRLVAKRPDRAHAWLLMARASRRLGLRAQALRAIDQAERLRPGHPPIVEERRLLRRPCWIATLVFGADRHPAVVALRQWRDERLLGCVAGRVGVLAYDVTAPLLCRVLADRPRVRRLLRRPLLALAARFRPDGACGVDPFPAPGGSHVQATGGSDGQET